jgi:hypothetical protein
MSQENVEIVRGGYEAFAQGDVERVLEIMDPEVEWAPALAPLLGVEPVRGKDALRKFLIEDLAAGFEDFEDQGRGSRSRRAVGVATRVLRLSSQKPCRCALWHRALSTVFGADLRGASHLVPARIVRQSRDRTHCWFSHPS